MKHSLAKGKSSLLSCVKRAREKNLQPWNVAEEDSNTKSDNRGYKDIDILHWRMLEHAQSTASSCKQVTNKDVKEYSYLQKRTYPHCIRTKVKKYTLCASLRRSLVRPFQLPYFSTRDEKGTPFDWRYQNALVYVKCNEAKKRRFFEKFKLTWNRRIKIRVSQETRMLAREVSNLPIDQS